MKMKISKVIPPFYRALKFPHSIAIRDQFGNHSYRDVFERSVNLSKYILRYTKRESNHPILQNGRVAFLCQNDSRYVIGQWASWMSGGIAVPLCKTHPKSELEYIILDSKPSILVCGEEYSEKMNELALEHKLNLICLQSPLQYQKDTGGFFQLNLLNTQHQSQDFAAGEELKEEWEQRDWGECNAQLIYTSGTTGRPKGVVTTFSNLASQIEDINEVWQVTCEDKYMHVLPLHHVHGVVNALASPLSVGASVTMLTEFDAEKVWHHLLEDEHTNVFHAVPTIYAKLIEYYWKHFGGDEQRQADIKEKLFNKYRLMVSGSAALPQTILDEWRNISGHFLLERYGMTEIGMALTNPLEGKRVEGSVGRPFPSVQFQIKTDKDVIVSEGNHHSIVSYVEDDVEGSLLVKGTSVFKEYWGKPEATQETFDQDGWFVTGDTAIYDKKNDVVRILGRTSVDIIKSGGYKISALEIERHLLSHENIKEVAVFGIDDSMYGEKICAMVVIDDGNGGNTSLSLEDLQEWCVGKMTNYKFPRHLAVVNQIPKNAMGKVNKKQLKKDLNF